MHYSSVYIVLCGVLSHTKLFTTAELYIVGQILLTSVHQTAPLHCTVHLCGALYNTLHSIAIFCTIQYTTVVYFTTLYNTVVY